MPQKTVRLALAAALLAPAALATAQEHAHSHSHGASEQLGTVHFPTSCRNVDAEFTRAVALLHSFGYEESRDAFQAVAAKDPSCGMAYWGVAMTWYHPLWAPPSPRDLAAGAAAADKARELGAKTERERGYIGAIGTFYRDWEHRNYATRANDYKAAMEALSRKLPDDHEATIFYALEVRATAPENDPTYAEQKRSAKLLNDLLPLEPNHPGITHYMIHAFDYPGLASEALPAARAYAKIAPSSPHALHMPSHIFTRLGLWQESIDSNLASADAGRSLVARTHPGAAAYDTLHALDYLEYAYLQTGDDANARRVLDEAAAAKTFDEPAFQAAYALAAIPARWTLERRDWKAASALEPSRADFPWQNMRYVPAITFYAQALGAARGGNPGSARTALAELEKIHAALVKSPVPGPYDWAAQVESMRLAAAAWVDSGEARQEEALKTARSAADLEDRTGKHSVTPGVPIPARELLGDMLLDMGRPSEALAEYDASLHAAPNRFNGLLGAARAAKGAGNTARARSLYRTLVAQCRTASASAPASERPGLSEARAFLAGAPAAGGD
jgi:tetratricopeptide (TPR) repeat protein